jgi:uncharacterized protein (DUF433 family)
MMAAIREVAMAEIKLAEGIVSDPEVCGGRPRIAGTRITVAEILAALGAGDTIDELVADFPYLSREGILAALKYAASNFDYRVIAAAE